MSDKKKQRASTWAPVSAVGIRELFLWLCGKRTRITLDGASMEPGLPDGTVVLIRSTHSIHEEDIVLCRHPFKTDTRIVKRVREIEADGLFVVGDNPSQSTDSRSFGVVPWVHVIGVVTSQMPS